MKFGVAIPTCAEELVYKAPFTTTQGLIQLSQEAEELGYDSVWANDHMTTQRYVKRLSLTPPNFFEPLISLSMIASATKKIRLATGVMVLPQRNPVVLAKQVSTLDVFSNGRVILGVGLGAYREEFEAVNPTLKDQNRGPIVDECIYALRVLFSQRSASFNGRFIRFKDIEMYPKPIQSRLPIYIGGNSSQGIKRAAELGDGWFPAVLSPLEMADKMNTLKEYIRRAGRSMSEIEVAPQFMVSLSKDREEALRVFRKSRVYEHLESLRTSTLRGQVSGTLEERNLVGTPSDIIKKMEEYVELGVTYFAALVFMGGSQEDLMKNMTLFAKEVIPSFK
ncbi:MAG: LLM class flavin-dependent oxidoreductase [Candidatus Bathyarchaeia archaeon]